jgi:hypothetical protein
VASAFMIAHDYGFKRVMSSYYFSNTDQVFAFFIKLFVEKTGRKLGNH